MLKFTCSAGQAGWFDSRRLHQLSLLLSASWPTGGRKQTNHAIAFSITRGARDSSFDVGIREPRGVHEDNPPAVRVFERQAALGPVRVLGGHRWVSRSSQAGRHLVEPPLLWHVENEQVVLRRGGTRAPV